jgi:diguanylate cyclase (GGDEF)-like protein
VTAPPAIAPAGALTGLLQALGQPAWLVQQPGLTVCAINQEALDLLMLDADGALGQPAEHLLATPEDLAYWDEVRAGGQRPLHSDAVLLAGGQPVPVSRRIRPVPLPGQREPDHFLVLLEDRSALQRQNDDREQLLAELQATLEATADGILVTDLDGRIRGFNQRFAEIWRLPPALLTQRDDGAVFDWLREAVSDPAAYHRQLAMLDEPSAGPTRDRLHLLTGQVVERVSRLQLRQGLPCGRVWSFRDLTELVSATQRIETLATTDSLTGLLNRRQMTAALTDALRQARTPGRSVALLLLDLDRFKQINDGLGQQIGDRVLLEAADRLKASLRQGDLVARLGGDQFAVLVHGTDHRGAETSAKRLLDTVAQPMAVGSLPFTLTVSLGVALFPDDAGDAETLMRHAESAMQRAKAGGRACVRFHQPQHDADLRQRMRLDHAMRQALACQRFRLHYQPQVALADGRVVGAEALIRWRDPELGEVSPGQFIPVAEDTGFIVPIGDWVLDQAVRQAAAWQADGLALPVSVNVSALQFSQGDFQERVAKALRDHQLPGALLELELTESVLVQDADDALARLSQLAALGVRLAIDDFGTGYSSLAYLKRFPIDRLKIDRSFIKGVPGNDSDRAIVRAVVQMAQALGMKVVAEGVETEPQRAFLQELGCDEFQGFLFAPALDAITFAERVMGRRRRPRLALVGR